MTALIIEDEVSAQDLLKCLIKENFPQLEVVKCIDNIKDSVDFFCK